MNYYNEFDPQAAQWLRATLIQVLTAGNASDQSAYDMSGTKPKPSTATNSSLNFARRRALDVPACVQPPAHGFRRTTRKTSALSGWLGKIYAGCCQAATLPSLLLRLYRKEMRLACASESCELISHYLLSCTRRSTATCCTDQGLLGTMFRIACNYGRSMRLGSGSFCGMRPCTLLNSTFDVNLSAASLFRIERTSEGQSLRISTYLWCDYYA